MTTEAEVTVSYSRSIPIERPTKEQFARLMAVVQRAYPQQVVSTFERDDDRQNFFRGFIASFEYLAHVRRPVDLGGMLVLNKEADASWWAIEAQRWLLQQGTQADVTNGSFFVAVIAMGDTAYSFPDRDRGIRSAYVSLSYRDGVKPSAAGWRRVLLDSWQPHSPVAALAPDPASEVVRRGTPMNQQESIAARVAENDAYVRRESSVIIVSR
jgi:hypothetical protein